MESKPFVIKKDKTGEALEPISPKDNKLLESWLQELIHAHPQILPVDEIEPVFSPLTSIGREITTATGSIDNLLISKAGYVVLVETKLWRNPQAKREVLAQAIDYAGELSKWSFEQLDGETRKHNRKGLLEAIQEAFDLDPEEMPDEDTIAKNLRLGRFLILVVSDRIRSSLVDMMSYVNRYPHLATNVGLVELQCYKIPGDQGEMIVVPSLAARTEIVERSIVEVTISPNIEHKLDVKQINTEDGGALSWDAYWEALKRKSPASVDPAKKILDRFDEYPDIKLKMRKTAVVARLSIPESDQRLSLFFIDTDGTLTCWIHKVREQIAIAGLAPALGEEYIAGLCKLLIRKSKKLSIYYPIEKVNPDDFICTVDCFIEKIRKSESKGEV